MHLRGKAPYKSVIIITSSGAGCICDYTNIKSPPYTLYTLKWCTLSVYMVYTFENGLEKKHLSLLLNVTSSGAGCICDYTNTKSPPYTLYTRVVYTFWFYGVHFREVFREKNIYPYS